MKRKIYACPKCGRALNFSDNSEYTFQCFECDEDFYAFEAKEIEQPRMEGIVDFTELAKASIAVKEITDTAINESIKEIEIKGKDIVEQICEYINETVKPILDAGIYQDRNFRDHARIYSRHFRINFGEYLLKNGWNQVQFWGENGILAVYFGINKEYCIDKQNNTMLPLLVKEWPELKDSMNRMIPYALKECNKANEKKLEQQKEVADIINNFRL